MIIVEHCQYGNIQEFLRKNRQNFIDQIDRDTDEIDESITETCNKRSNDSGR